MTYTFTVSKDFKVIVAQNGNNIDEVGAFESEESAAYWAGEMTKKYDENPTFVYPSEQPDGETL